MVMKLLNYLKKETNNQIHQHVSLIFNIYENEILVSTDSGRIVRPLLKVENNQLVLTKKMLDDIDLGNNNINKINKWNNFLVKYPNVVEYIDIAESEYTMISMYLRDL